MLAETTPRKPQTKYYVIQQSEFNPGFSGMVDPNPLAEIPIPPGDEFILHFPVDGSNPIDRETFAVYNDGIYNQQTGQVEIPSDGIYSISLAVYGYANTEANPPVIFGIARGRVGTEDAVVINSFPPTVDDMTDFAGRVYFQTTTAFTADLNAGDTIFVVTMKLAPEPDPVWVTGLSRFSVQNISTIPASSN